MRPPKQDHYEIARAKALNRLRSSHEPVRLERLGAVLDGGSGTITVPMLCWRVETRLEPYAMRLLAEDVEPDLTWQILVLNYLAAERPAPPTEFVSFADFAEGRGYESAYRGRVNQRLSHTVGRQGDTLKAAVEGLDGTIVEGDPMRCILRFFPLLEFQVVRHEGDEDFPPSCTVLMPDNTLQIFSLEDGIVAAERLVSALEGKSPAGKREAAQP
ncbi:MAG: DUF3786 domain-containing protein [Candidatus Brocadiia bacterium]